MERSLLQSDILAKERTIQSLKQELDHSSSSREKEKDGMIRELNEAYNNLKKSREENERLKEEISIALEQIGSLSKVMERVKGELEVRTQELEKYKERLENINEDYNKLNSQVVTLRNQKQELEHELHSTKERVKMMQNEIEENNKELRKEKVNYEEMKKKAKEFSNTIDTVQQVLNNINKILTDTSTQYSQQLAPLLINNKDIFGIEFTRFTFPKVTALDAAEHLENLLKWANAFRVFIDSMANTAKDIKNNVSFLNSNLSKERAVNDNLNNELNDRATEIYRLKDSLQLLNNKNNELHNKLIHMQDELSTVNSE